MNIMTVKKSRSKEPNKRTPAEHERGVEMLKNFGLSENEALVYVYLLERGTEVGGSKIAIGAHIHRQYAYISIHKLISLGLVEAVAHGRQHKYKAVAPSQIEKLAKRRAVQAEDIVRELNAFSTVGHEQDFEVHQGYAQLQEFEIGFVNSLKTRSTQYVIGGASDHFCYAMEDRYDEFASIAKRKELITYYLGPEEEFLTLKKAQEAYPNFIYRTAKNFPKGVLNTVIREDSVALYSFAKPPLVYVIKSKTVAENYKNFFMMLWNMAQVEKQ